MAISLTAASLADLLSATDGPVPISEPVVIASTRDEVYDFGGRQLEWLGPPGESMFVLKRCQGCTFKRLRVWATNPGLAAFAVTGSTDPTGGYVSTNNHFEDCYVYGPGLQFGWTFDHRIGGGGDANNDCMELQNCRVDYARDTAFNFNGTQSMLHNLVRCGAHGNYVTKHCVRHDHCQSVRIVDGGGGKLADYAYVLGPLTGGRGVIDGPVWELNRGGLLRVTGTATTPVQVSVKHCRFDQSGGSDFVIDVGAVVPSMAVEDNLFDCNPDESGRLKPMKFRFGAQVGRFGGSVSFQRNVVFHRKVGAQWPELQVSPWLKGTVVGNSYWEYQTPRGVWPQVR